MTVCQELSQHHVTSYEVKQTPPTLPEACVCVGVHTRVCMPAYTDRSRFTMVQLMIFWLYDDGMKVIPTQ